MKKKRGEFGVYGKERERGGLAGQRKENEKKKKGGERTRHQS